MVQGLALILSGFSQNTLSFINDEASSIHGNIRLSSVYISQSGEWRLGGFEVLSSMKDDDAMIYVRLPSTGYVCCRLADFRRGTEASPLNLVDMLLPKSLSLAGTRLNVIHCPQWTHTILEYWSLRFSTAVLLQAIRSARQRTYRQACIKATSDS